MTRKCGMKKMYKDVLNKISKDTAPEDAASMIFSLVRDRGIPVDIIQILKELGFDVYLSGNFNNNTSGIIAISAKLKEKYGNSKIVIINKTIKMGKKMFVAAHELAHYIFDFDEKTQLSYFNAYEHSDESNPGDEERANKFAANLLMPRDEFRKKYDDLFGQDIPLYEITEKIAEYFKVSAKAVEKRYFELGISDDKR